MLQNLSLFSGVGGLDLSAKWTEKVKTIAYVEWSPSCQDMLMSRMRSKDLDWGPIWDDITTFDGKPLRNKVDIVSGGFPCQPHSGCGKRGGAKDKRNLWPEFMRIVQECRPSFILGENVGGILSNGFAQEVLASLEEAGYCATPTYSTSCAFGAPFPRKRVFFIAHSMCLRCNVHAIQTSQVKCRKKFRQRRSMAPMAHLDIGRFGTFDIPDFGRVEHGFSNWVDGLKAMGNAVDPYAAQPAWQKIIEMSEMSSKN